jgi:hypothetical protein
VINATCPSCGESKFASIQHTNYPGERRVICNFLIGGCGTATAPADTDEQAIANFNRRPKKKLIAHYVMGIGGFYLTGATIPESHKKLGLIPLGEIDGPICN